MLYYLAHSRQPSWLKPFRNESAVSGVATPSRARTGSRPLNSGACVQPDALRKAARTLAWQSVDEQVLQARCGRLATTTPRTILARKRCSGSLRTPASRSSRCTFDTRENDISIHDTGVLVCTDVVCKSTGARRWWRRPCRGTTSPGFSSTTSRANDAGSKAAPKVYRCWALA